MSWIKICSAQDETPFYYRRKLDEDTITEVLKHARKLFAQDCDHENIVLSFKDKDGDLCRLETTKELQYLLENEGPSAKILVSSSPKVKKEDERKESITPVFAISKKQQLEILEKQVQEIQQQHESVSKQLDLKIADSLSAVQTIVSGMSEKIQEIQEETKSTLSLLDSVLEPICESLVIDTSKFLDGYNALKADPFVKRLDNELEEMEGTLESLVCNIAQWKLDVAEKCDILVRDNNKWVKTRIDSSILKEDGSHIIKFEGKSLHHDLRWQLEKGWKWVPILNGSEELTRNVLQILGENQ